jgi:hypothetical protein
MPHPGSSALPRTYVGRWLRAALLGQQELRDQLATTLNGGVKGWNDDERAVAGAACELITRRYFGDEPTDEEISDVARMIMEATAGEKEAVSQQNAAAVIRSALGETIELSGIRPGQLYLARTTTIYFAAKKLRLPAGEVDALLREAERVAFERGWHPALAPRRSTKA